MAEDKESQESKILKEINKSGFPTEIISSSIMQREGWGVIHNPSFLDESESCSREFDIRAFCTWPINEKSLLNVFLLCECKKSEKPWVFL